MILILIFGSCIGITIPLEYRQYKRWTHQLGKDINITHHYDYQYSDSIQIGTPSKNFTVIYDAGQSILRIPTFYCNKCHQATYFNTSESSTCKNLSKEGVAYYRSGYCEGYFGYDILGLDNLQQKQKILFVDYDQDYENITTDGIMGLSNNKTYDNLFDLAYKNKQIKSNRYAFEWISVFNKNQWVIGVKQFKVNGEQISIQNGTYVLIDSGIEGLYFNEETFDKSTLILTKNKFCVYIQGN